MHTLDSPLDYSWYLPKETALYLRRRNHIGATCRLSDAEEELLMNAADSTRLKMEVVHACAKENQNGWKALLEQIGGGKRAVLEASFNKNRVYRTFMERMQLKL